MIKLIKKGNKLSKKLGKERHKKCPICGCKFTYTYRDLIKSTDILNKSLYSTSFVKCPDCKQEVFVNLWCSTLEIDEMLKAEEIN